MLSVTTHQLLLQINHFALQKLQLLMTLLVVLLNNHVIATTVRMPIDFPFRSLGYLRNTTMRIFLLNIPNSISILRTSIHFPHSFYLFLQLLSSLLFPIEFPQQIFNHSCFVLISVLSQMSLLVISSNVPNYIHVIVVTLK